MAVREVNEAFLKGALLSVCEDKSHYELTLVASEEIGEVDLQLWRYLPVDNLAGARFFLVPAGESSDAFLFEINFLSRHEIIPPMTSDTLPVGWEEWGMLKEANLLVYNREKFTMSLLTQDAFIALPRYRFDNLLDDIGIFIEENFPGQKLTYRTIIRSISNALRTPYGGFSFSAYVVPGGGYKLITDNVLDRSETKPVVCQVYSVIEGMLYEDLELRRLTSEYLDIREAR